MPTAQGPAGRVVLEPVRVSAELSSSGRHRGPPWLASQLCEWLRPADDLRTRRGQGVEIVHGTLKCRWASPEPFHGRELGAQPFRGDGIEASPAQFHRDPAGVLVQEALEHGPFGIGREPLEGVGVREQLVAVSRESSEGSRRIGPHGIRPRSARG